MISDFETNSIYFSELLKTDKKFTGLFKELRSKLDSVGISPKFLPKTKDIWARDYMPIQVAREKFIEYRYDPDYLQGVQFRHLKTYPDIVCDAIELKTIKSDIILDGGNVVKNKSTLILTDKIIEENKKSYSKSRLSTILKELFEIQKLVFIPRDKKCPFGHADGMLRFIGEDRVLISGFYETIGKSFTSKLLAALKAAGISWEWLRCSEKEEEENIAYINFLQTRDLILLPKLNRLKEDENALKAIKSYFPDYNKRNRIFQIDTSELFKLGGALNCISWTTEE
jgi:agmatine/peptidylarginine deiminase